MSDGGFARIVHGLRLRHVDDAAADATYEDHVARRALLHQVPGNLGGIVVGALEVDGEHALYAFRRKVHGVAVLAEAGAGDQVGNAVVLAEDLAERLVHQGLVRYIGIVSGDAGDTCFTAGFSLQTRSTSGGRASHLLPGCSCRNSSAISSARSEASSSAASSVHHVRMCIVGGTWGCGDVLCRSAMARLAPLRTSDRLMARPRPLAPPVMTAVLFASEKAGKVVAECRRLAALRSEREHWSNPRGNMAKRSIAAVRTEGGNGL